MNSRQEPLVSVITPFYNTAQYLPECIESVLGQTYSNWEYVLVNNCSTDGSAEIAERYAAMHPTQIRVVRNSHFLSQVQNYNYALQQMSPLSNYCKIVQADDLIFPECLEKMVRLAESDPGIGIVTSYFMRGDRVTGGPIPLRTHVIRGIDVGRWYFERGLAVFGSPTTNLFRSSLVRGQAHFYEEGRLHEDVDALFRVLKDWNLGFVHQVLSFERTDNVSISSKIACFASFQLDQFLRVLQYADQFLSPKDARARRIYAERLYLQFLARKWLRCEGKLFFRYHVTGLRTVGYEIPRLKFFFFLLTELMDIIGNPKQTISKLIGKAKHKLRAD